MFKIKSKYSAVATLALLVAFALLHDVLGLLGISIFLLLIVLVSVPILSRLLTAIRFFIIDLFFHPIIVNAFIMTRYGMIKHFNLGDDLNWYLIKKIQPQKISLLNDSIIGRCAFFKKENYLIIGSTITFKTNQNTIIWGAGVIDGDSPLRSIPKKVCAVRGPLTRDYLIKKGVDCPAIYGDPAMLIKYFYKPHVEKKYKLGIIPHYIDFYSDKFKDLRKDPEVLFIKMQNYKSVDSVINEIASCDRILSSSLHGLILSEMYGVPNVWITVSDNISGGSFKYLDYYASIGIFDIKPNLFTGNEKKEDLIKLFDNYKKGFIDLEPLIKAAPFKLNTLEKK